MKFSVLRIAIRLIIPALAAYGVAACSLLQRVSRAPLCTLIGCGPSLEISLVGDHVPTDFSMQLSSSSGTLINVHCTEGTSQFDPPEAGRWSPSCPPAGVSFQDFTPRELTVTVQWADGQVTQDFQPIYPEARPNGPGCEPVCRVARLAVRIPVVPPYGDVSTWRTYTDATDGFSLLYPAALPLEPGPELAGQRTLFLGDNMQVGIGPIDPLVCKGDCPMLESTEPVKVAGRDAHLVRGYVGSIGGNIPQRFMLYLVRSGPTYISLSLYAAGRNAPILDSSVILPLQEEDIELFDRIVQTLKWAP